MNLKIRVLEHKTSWIEERERKTLSLSLGQSLVDWDATSFGKVDIFCW